MNRVAPPPGAQSSARFQMTPKGAREQATIRSAIVRELCRRSPAWEPAAQSRRLGKKHFGWFDRAQISVYSRGGKPKWPIPAKGGETMYTHGSSILATAAAVALLGSVHSLRAEEFAGSVAGVVKSASGQTLPGAYVKLINADRRLTFMVVSRDQGRYIMGNLPPGNY